MTAKKRATLVAERLRAVAVAPIAAAVAHEITLKQATPRVHAALLPTWDVPHVAGRLDGRRRISLHALHGCPDTDLFDVSFEGPWIVLTPGADRPGQARTALLHRWCRIVRRDGDHDGHVGSSWARNRYTQARLVAFDLTARTTRNIRPDYADQFERFFNRTRCFACKTPCAIALSTELRRRGLVRNVPTYFGSSIQAEASVGNSLHTKTNGRSRNKFRCAYRTFQETPRIRQPFIVFKLQELTE